MSGAISKSPKWRFSIFCGGRARPVSVVAESCALECGDRYVWRDGDGNWVAEVRAVAVMGDVVGGEGEGGVV